MSKIKQIIIAAITIITIFSGLSLGFSLAHNVKAALAAEQVQDVNTKISKSVRSSVQGDIKTTVTTILEVVSHSHDGLPLHEHLTTFTITANETCFDGNFHDLSANVSTSSLSILALLPPRQEHPTAATEVTAQNGTTVQPANEIIIMGREFMPGSLTVSAGTKITWINKDSETHTITSDTGLFNSTVEPTETFSFTFTEPGMFNYRCEFRSEMAGSITVK